jgi:ATP-dependent exoDNAse (exonuclease V) alpha subunit
MCKNIEMVKKTDFNSEFTFKHLSFTHKTRMEINEKCMDIAKAKYHHSDWVKLPKSKYDEHSQEVKLLPNVPIIAKVNNKELGIVNNEEFIIDKVKGNLIYISNEEHKMTIKASEFQNLFYVAYCITIHQSQGQTIKIPYNIWDWEKLDKRLKYVAIGRAQHKNQINII